MLLEQTHFPLGKTSNPMNSNGSDLGAIIFMAILIIGVGVAVYISIDVKPVAPSLTKPEDEKH